MEAQVVREHELLFVVASELVGDRVSERRTIDARLRAAAIDRPTRRLKYENQQRADEQERQRLEQRLVALQRQADVKQRELALTEDIARAADARFDQGVLSAMDANRAKLEVEKLAGELEVIRAAMVDARNAMARITFEMASRTAAYAETERAIGEELTTYKARKERARSGSPERRQRAVGGSAMRGHCRDAARPQPGNRRGRRGSRSPSSCARASRCRRSCSCPSEGSRSSTSGSR